jgi:hypothetical protein
MSAGTGILHSEKNDSWRLQAAPEHADPVHFVQMWVVPDTERIRPGYEQLDINPQLDRGGLVPVASGMARHDGASAIRIGQQDAALYAARMAPGETVDLPSAPYVHLFVPVGSVSLEGADALGTGDGVRITAADGQHVTAGPDGAEVLVWEMHGRLAGW